jgi:hypothetical protein
VKPKMSPNCRTLVCTYIDINDFDNVTQHMRDAIYCNGEDGSGFAKHLEELKAAFD